MRPKVVGDGAVDQHCDDCFFGLLFFLQVAGVLYMASFWLLNGGEEEVEQLGTKLAAATANDADVYAGATVKSVLVSAVAGIGSAILFLFVFFQMMESCARCLILTIAMLGPLVFVGGGTALLQLSYVLDAAVETNEVYLLGAAACGVLALLQLFWLSCCMWSRINGTAAILSNVSNVLGEMPGIVFVNYAAALVLATWWGACACAFKGAPMFLDQYDHPDGVKSGVNVLLLLCLYWGHETIRNVAHVTTCGTIGAWYFFPHLLEQGDCACCRPATCDSLRRALTTSFGSIAFGSLVLAIIDTVHALIRRLFDQLPVDNALLGCVRCCVECCLRGLKGCMEWLTEYAFVYVAIYGISFVEAGREVQELVVRAGVDAVAQSTLVWSVLAFGKVLGAVVGAAAACAASSAVPSPPEVAMAVGAAAGLVTAASGLTVVDSGCKTLLVCFAEEPQVLRSRKRELAQHLEQASRLVGRDGQHSSSLIVP